MKFLLKKYSCAFIMLFMIIPALSLKAQTSRNFQVMGGLTTFWIVNNNLATVRISPLPEESLLPGASFDGQQIGLTLRLLYGIDTKRKLRVTTGLDYYFLRGVQRSQGKAATLFLKYNVDMPVIVLGTEYALLEYPPGDARIYAGFEARGTFTSAEPITWRVVRLRDNLTIQEFVDPIRKENAFRIGGALRLGIDGELYDPLYVNLSTAYGIVNLIGRDHSRGELLTPAGYEENEGREGYIHNMLVTFSLQYRF